MAIPAIGLRVRNALDMRDRRIINSTNIITEWLNDTSITTYGTEGTVVYTYNTEYVLWRRTSMQPGVTPTVAPYDDDGTFWEEIPLGGGSITVAPAPPADPDPGDLWLDGGSGITYVWNMSTVENPDTTTTEVTQWIQTGGIGQSTPAEGFLTTSSGDARYVQQSGANYSTEIQTSIRNEIGAINTQFQDSTGTNQDLTEITFNTDGDEITFTDGTNSRTFSGGTNADAVNMLIDTAIAGNVWHYTTGGYYAEGDIVVNQSTTNIEFYEVVGGDITSAPANITTIIDASPGLTQLEVLNEADRNAVTYAREFFFPGQLEPNTSITAGQLITGSDRIWEARNSGLSSELGTPSYDNLANWIPISELEILADDPTGDNLQQGRFWYNNTDDELRYYNGRVIQNVLSADQLANLISTDLDAQRLEHHQNTVGEFAIVQTATDVPVAQSDVLTNPPRNFRNRVDARNETLSYSKLS